MLYQIKIVSAATAAVYLTGCSSSNDCDGQLYQTQADDDADTCTGTPCSGPDGAQADVDCNQLGLDSTPSVSNVACYTSDGVIATAAETGTCQRAPAVCNGACVATDNANNPYQEDSAFCMNPDDVANGSDAICTGAVCTGGSKGNCGNSIKGATETLTCVYAGDDKTGRAVTGTDSGVCAGGVTPYDDDGKPATCTVDGNECAAYVKVDGADVQYSSCSCAVASIGLDSVTALTGSDDDADSPPGNCVCIVDDSSEN